MFIPGKDCNVHGVNLFLDMGVGIGGDKWPAADLFCHFILEDYWTSFFKRLFKDKRIIELGSGNAMAGLLIDRLYDPKEIVISDMESHMDHIKHNIGLNEDLLRCKGITFDWCKPPTDIGKFDIVLAFECVYNEDLYAPLINALKISCHKASIVFLGLTRLFAKPSFFQMLLDNGFVYTMIPQESAPLEYRNETNGRDIGLFVIKYK
jgi:hypothetical protein